jgi:hypothetical protein
MVGKAHVINLPWQHVYDSAEKSAVTAARVRRFAERTGLRYSKAHYAVFGEYGRAGYRYPKGADHTLVYPQANKVRNLPQSLQ